MLLLPVFPHSGQCKDCGEYQQQLCSPQQQVNNNEPSTLTTSAKTMWAAGAALLLQ